MTDSDTTLCILGASGDLTFRLLLPALGQLLTEEPNRTVHLVGAGMDDWDDEKWRSVVADSFASADSSGATVDAVLAGATYRQTDITNPEDFAALLENCQGKIALYFAVPPAIAAKACTALESVQLPEGLVLALEKPFGTNEASARVLNEQLKQLVPEDQIHRIDHFLGRSTVLNVLGLRFANRVFEPVWSREHIESVTIRYDESLGLENRAGYYDKAGAMVDMIQSHLLQVLAIVAMDPPATLGAADFREAKATALRATSVWNHDAANNSRRARYTAGNINGRELPSYVDEGGVDVSRSTETLAEVTFEVATHRWAGVPFTLRSGKGLGEKCSEIVVRFRQVSLLPTGFDGSIEPSVLRLALGPDTMSLELNLNGPGDPFHLDRAHLEASFGEGARRAYSEVLSGILDGDPSLSVRGDTAERCWHIVQPVLDAWDANEVPLEEYPAGSSGPEVWPAV
ncbi:glucose-6-phosphate dehydrogenase (plasmid) [Coraliomargarita sp. W4R53]